MHSMSKKLSIFIVAFLLLTVFVTAFHHHDDGSTHNDCALCIFNLQSCVVDNQNNYDISINHYSLITPEHETITFFIAVKSFSSRAPPA